MIEQTPVTERLLIIFAAMASTGLLKQDVEELIISPGAIRRARMKHRKLFSLEVKATFDPAGAVLDGSSAS